MKSRLIRTTGTMPPGGFVFNDSVTGKQYNDTHTFFDARVRQIINDRLANKRLLKGDAQIDPGAVAIELSEQMCERMQGNKRFCSESPKAQSPRLVVIAPIAQGSLARKCDKCGSDSLKPEYCTTCSKLKIVGWKCQACGANLPK